MFSRRRRYNNTVFLFFLFFYDWKPHKMEMVMEYLMLMITVRILLTQVVIKKEIQQ